MIIKRNLYSQIKTKIEPGKVVVLYGPRRVGKTFLLNKLVEEIGTKKEKVNFLKGDSRVVQDNLSSLNPQRLIDFIGRETSLLIVDEAQKVPQIGNNLKILIDEFPKLRIIASGSVSFDLAYKLGEPLTGRKKTVFLYPVSASELIATKNTLFYKEIFTQHLIFGGYPELFSKSSLEEKKEYLDDLVDDYLFRDILELERVKNSKKLRDLLTLLAFQIGKEISLTELGANLGLHKDTVARYLDLMEKSFIIVNIRGFSRNLRKEIYKSSRWYFYDNGIRNALINNFNPLELRNDLGALWENYLVLERLKKQNRQSMRANNYFWRTYDQEEIDWVEERGGGLFGYEFKWQEKKKIKPPKSWKNSYPGARYKLITRQNYLEFIT